MLKTTLSLLLVLSGALFAGETGPAAPFPDIRAADFSAPWGADLPKPRCAPAGRRAEPPPQDWIDAVKRIYLSYQGMTPARQEELPAAALRQMEEDAVVYPSRAFKVTVLGRTAFVIENDNNDALYVNIFDEHGLHVAFGGVDENADFWWL